MTDWFDLNVCNLHEKLNVSLKRNVSFCEFVLVGNIFRSLLHVFH